VEAATAADPPTAGQLLAAERERQGLSRVEMAQRLHMSPSQVEALETGDYTRLPTGPFLRGFVRNYARALGLDADVLLAQLAQEGPHETAPRIVVPSQNIRFDPLGERLSNPYVKAAGLAFVAIALGFAAMYWWLFIRPTPPAAHKPADMPPPSGAPATRPSAATAAIDSAPSTAGAASPAPGTVSPAAPASAPSSAAPASAAAKAEPSKAEPPKAEPPKADTATKAAAAPGEASLQFRFKGDSWVEVRDARDRVLFQRLNAADSEATVTGRPPLRVIVGNAPEVTLRYNGRDFPLEPHTKVAVARFTLE
jgi:cytoskeleton protein RodZ